MTAVGRHAAIPVQDNGVENVAIPADLLDVLFQGNEVVGQQRARTHGRQMRGNGFPPFLHLVDNRGTLSALSNSLGTTP